MAASYEIKLDADETSLDRTIDRQYDKLDRLADKASSIDIGGSSRGGVGGSSGTGLVSDPWGRHEDALTDLHAARQMGLSGDRLKPFEYQAARAGKQALRAERLLAGEEGKRGNLMLDIANTGSIGSIVSQMTTFLGPMGMGGMAAAMGMAKMYGAGIASGHDLGSAYYIGGGTGAETSSVSMIGRFLGRSASESAGAAVQFGDALRGDTFGAGYFRSRGIVDLGGLTVDKDKNYISAVKQLAEEPNRDMATRVARDTGLSSELWMRDLSSGERNSLINDMSDNQSEGSRRSVASYNFKKAKAQGFLESAWREFVNHPVTSWTTFMATGDDQQVDDGPIFNSMKAFDDIILGTQGGTDYLIHPEVRNRKRGPITAGIGHGNTDPYLNPYNVRTQAGFSGGGPRAQSAVPASVRSNQLSQNVVGYGRYLGGYPG